MSWYAWLLIVVGAVGVFVLLFELPAIRRYLRMKKM